MYYILHRVRTILIVRSIHNTLYTERTGSLAQDVLTRQRNDRTQREDEVVHIGGVEVVGSDGIGDGVGGHVVGSAE